MLRIYIRYTAIAMLCCYAQLSYAQCFDIQDIEVLSSIDAVKSPQRKMVNSYLNKCLTLEDIKQLTQKLNNLYISKGYITTRVTIPQQNLSQGKLILNVQPGYVEEIQVIGVDNKVKSTLPFHQGAILNLRDVEQAVDHFANNPTNNLGLTIEPGKDIGGTIVKLNNTPEKKWQFTSIIDNHGSKSKGLLQHTIGLTIDNLIGLNESLNFSHLHTLDDRDERYTKSSTASFAVPFGYNQLQFLYNHATYLNHIKTKAHTYRNQGNSSVFRIKLQHTLHRDNISKTNIHVAGQYDKYNNYFAENVIALSTYKLHKWEAGFNHQRRLSASVVSFGSAFIVGKLHNYKLKLQTLNTPKKQFHKLTYFVGWYKPLPINHFNYQLQLSGQYTPNMLVPTEKQTVGGLSSVRGYKDKIANADNVNIVRNELVFTLPKSKSDNMNKLLGNNKIFIAYDYGKHNSYQESSKRKHGYLAGVAAGIRNQSGRVIYNFTWGKALRAIDRNSKKPIVVSFSLGVKI